MKIAILYTSIHHGNTEKLIVDLHKCASTETLSIDIYNLLKEEPACEQLENYDIIGLASGIYAGKIHKKLSAFINTHIEKIQTCFFICTSGLGKGAYAKKFSQILEEKGIWVLGSFECKGYDTFGPFKLIGGICKNRPNQEDLLNCRKFLKEILPHT